MSFSFQLLVQKVSAGSASHLLASCRHFRSYQMAVDTYAYTTKLQAGGDMSNFEDSTECIDYVGTLGT